MPLLRRRLFAVVVATLVALEFSSNAAAGPLAAYRVPANKIYVAGISSGGAMAVQMSVAYSRLFKGAAIYAGIPYDCAQGSEATALTTCEEDAPPIDLAALESITHRYAAERLIDPLRYLKDQRIYLWSGTLDVTVRQAAMDLLRTYYNDLHAHVFRYDNDFKAAHGWESPYGPNPCDVENTPFVVLCRESDRGGASPNPYDSEQVWLSRFFGKLKPKNDGKLSGLLVPFDQNEFAPGAVAASIGMDTTGYAFVPQTCAAQKSCGLILALHGCNQYHGEIGTAFIDDAGLNQWADTNNIVVLYPQTIATTPANPAGCWNWWGYLHDADYAQKSGAQMRALYLMVNRASRRRD